MSKRKKTKGVTPVEVLSKGWDEFNSDLSKLTEAQLSKALELEINGKNRSSYIDRIHGRFNSVRVERERREIAEKAMS